MKKVIYGLFAALVLLSACDKNEDYVEALEGSYVSEGDLVFTVRLADAKCTSLTAEDNNGVLGTWTNIKTSGSYPNYTYSLDGFYIRARYYDNNSFSGFIDGVLTTGQAGPNFGNEVSIVVEGSTVDFTRKR